MSPKISLIVAISKNRAIGKGNKLIWFIPEDLQRFKKLTSGHPIIMGRKTFESIGKALPNRTNIVISKDLDYKALGCILVHSLDEALLEAKKIEGKEIFIIGGGQIFEQAMPLADKLYLTVIEQRAEGDVFFPDYPHFTKKVFEEEKDYQGLKFRFLELERE